MKLKIKHQMCHDHPFSQRNKALKRAGQGWKKIEKKERGRQYMEVFIK